MKTSPKRWMRIVCLLVGGLFFAIWILSFVVAFIFNPVFLTIIPHYPFFILAIIFLAIGSKKFNTWILSRKWLGRIIRAGCEGMTIKWKVIVIISSIFFTLLFAYLLKTSFWMNCVTIIMMLIGIVFILTRPTKK